MISFLESLAFIGLILPGMIIMGGLGSLIGTGKLNLYNAWFLSTIGCILGDTISYCIGIKYAEKIKKIRLIQKKIKFFDKTKHALKKYSFISIFIGKFIGPIRPLIPITSGVLKIPIYKFIVPNYMACSIWPIIYFFPGILGTMLVQLVNKIPKVYFFLIYIILLIITFFMLIYFFYILYNIYMNKTNKTYLYLLYYKKINYLIIMLCSIIFLEIYSIIYYFSLTEIKNFLKNIYF